jgi:glycosyltransferase involved in cell wall biosynthesis
MRVAYTIEQCWHRVPGGTAVAAIETARALRRRAGIELRGVAARHSAPPVPPYEPPMPVHHLGLPRIALYDSWHYLRRPRVDGATGPIDAIHATTIAIPPRSAPLVVTIHDLAFVHDPTHFTTRGLRFFRRGLTLAHRDADLIVCPSDATARDCLAAGFEQDRVAVVPMGVQSEPASEEEVARARRRYGLHRPYLLWTGTIEPRKNLARLLLAYRSLGGDVDLVLVGPRGWKGDLDALMDEDRTGIKALGFVPQSDLGPLYAGATVFCFPSLLEGFGFPVLEAMAQGTPVVTSEGTSTEELARDAGVLVDPTDPEDIARGIRSVMEDEGLARRLRDAGPARSATYTWERTAELMAACYEKVAG